MTPIEKKERINYLWRKLRMFVFMKHVVRSVQDDVEDDFLKNISEEVEYGDVDEIEDDDDKELPWYMIRKTRLSMVVWDFLFSVVVTFNMITVPLMITFPEVLERLSENVLYFELFFEALWVIQILLKFVTADPPKTRNIEEVAKGYIFPYFFLDLLATGPSILFLLINKRDTGKYFMIIRFSHWQQIFTPVEFIFERLTMSKVKKAQFMTLAQVFVGILMLAHVCACIWIIIGMSDPIGGTTWLYANDFPPVEGNERYIWVFSFYWIFEVFTTVGYGDYSGGTEVEYWYSLFLEFVGVVVPSVLISVMTGVFEDNSDFASLLVHKMDELNFWTRKIELSRVTERERHLKPSLYSELIRNVRDAFLYDFNLIVEEFTMYQQLTPKMQNSLISTLDVLKEFQLRYDHFFGSCEQGFKNEFIMQMYFRQINPEPENFDREVQGPKKRFREIYFITSGSVSMLTPISKQLFMFLPPSCIFGDYFVYFKLDSNILFESSKDEVT